jgi:hypothetical protein
MNADLMWHGTENEWDELIVAVARNCTCGNRRSPRERRCPAHQLLDDQRPLDGLLFARHIAPRLMQEEMAERLVAVAEL